MYTCQNATLLEITCQGSFLFFSFQLMFWSLSDDLVSAITDDKVKVYQKVSTLYICQLMFRSLSDDLVSAITDDKVKVYQKVSTSCNRSENFS